MSNESEHLKILSMFHYVLAGIVGLFSCFPSLHLVMGILLASGVIKDPNDPFLMQFVGWFFILFASGFMLVGWTFATSLFLAGRYLQQRKRYTFCLVMAGMECIFMPFGTVLGVFTIITLVKESVKAQFEAGHA